MPPPRKLEQDHWPRSCAGRLFGYRTRASGVVAGGGCVTRERVGAVGAEPALEELSQRARHGPPGRWADVTVRLNARTPQRSAGASDETIHPHRGDEAKSAIARLTTSVARGRNSNLPSPAKRFGGKARAPSSRGTRADRGAASVCWVEGARGDAGEQPCETLVDDDALKRNNAELQTLFADAREDCRTLQEEVEDQKVNPPPRSGWIVIGGIAGAPSHLRQYFHMGSLPSALSPGYVHLKHSLSAERRSSRRYEPALTPQRTAAACSPPPAPHPKRETSLVFTCKIAGRADGSVTPAPIAPTSAPTYPQPPTPGPCDVGVPPLASAATSNRAARFIALVEQAQTLLQLFLDTESLSLTNRLKRAGIRGAERDVRALLGMLCESEMFNALGEARVLLNEAVLDSRSAQRVSEAAMMDPSAPASARWEWREWGRGAGLPRPAAAADPPALRAVGLACTFDVRCASAGTSTEDEEQDGHLHPPAPIAIGTSRPSSRASRRQQHDLPLTSASVGGGFGFLANLVPSDEAEMARSLREQDDAMLARTYGAAGTGLYVM
ncbi:hypothetical protein B0H13DRAFT_2545773 [Mycena leptocephala]|nr:hypothetical protein B0H13DRAFT_2545773 [Mycena leptocephala]